jgi:hypothetical protein
MVTPVLVLSTVNARYSQKLDAQMLAQCLLELAAAKQMPGHVSSFFSEVESALQLDNSGAIIELGEHVGARASERA